LRHLREQTLKSQGAIETKGRVRKVRELGEVAAPGADSSNDRSSVEMVKKSPSLVVLGF
jgi:hypothetical protein